MIAQYRVVLRDRDGNEGSATRNNVALSSFADMVAECNTFASAVQGLSDARVVRGSISIQLFSRRAVGVAPTSDVLRQLIIVASGTTGYVLHSVPSARLNLPGTEADGNGDTFRLIASLLPSLPTWALDFVALSGATMTDEFGRQTTIDRLGAIVAR